MAAGAFGGIAGVLIANQVGKGKRKEMASAGFPMAQSMTFVVTDRRLFVLSGKLTLGVLTPDALAGAVVVKKNAISPWTIRIDLTNGRAVTLEANSFMGPADLVAAIDRVARSA